MSVNLSSKGKSVRLLSPIFLVLLLGFSLNVSLCFAQTSQINSKLDEQDIWRAPYTNLTTEEAWAIYDSDDTTSWIYLDSLLLEEATIVP